MAAHHLAEPDRRVSGDGERKRSSLRSRPAIIAILALAFALRAIMAVRTSVMFEDGPHFLSIAKLFANGDWAGALSHPYHPLYSLLISATRLLIDDWEIAALSVSVVAGTAAVLASYLFLRDAFDPRSAVFAAFLLAISPYAVRFTSDIESEGIYLAFFMAAVALLFRGLLRGGASLLFAAGVCSGFAYLARPEGAGLVLVGVGLLVLRGYRDGWRASRVVAACSALVAGAAIIAAPYLRVLTQQRGALVLSGKKSVIRILGLAGEAANPLASDTSNAPLLAFVFLALIVGVCVAVTAVVAAGAVSRRRNFTQVQKQFRTRVGVAVAASLLLGWLLLWPSGLQEFASVVISTLRPEVAALVLLGCYASFSAPSSAPSSASSTASASPASSSSSNASSQRGLRPRDAFVGSLLLFYGLVLLGLLANYGYLSRRHVLPLVPLLLGHAGLGAGWLVDRYVKCDPGKRLAGFGPAAFKKPAGVLAGLALLLFAIAAPKALRDHREDALAERLAAEWLRDQALEPGRLASNKRRTAYYAERDWLSLSDASGLRSLESLVGDRARYIVVGDRAPLPPGQGFELRELHRVSAGGRGARVYELLRSTPFESRQVSAGIGAGPPNFETH